MRRPLGWAVSAAIVLLSASTPDFYGFPPSRPVPAASQKVAISPPVPATPSPAVPEQVSGPDYALANWIPASPANFTVANRPHDHPIDFIVIHDTEGPAAWAAQLFQDPSRQAAANYIVSAGGQVVQMVLEKDIAWQAGNWDYNTRSIGIENEGYAYVPGSFTWAEYHASARLAASICSRWGVPIDRNHVIGHYQVPDPNNPGLYGGESHRTDPGPYWDWAYYIGLAASYASALPSPPRMEVDPVATNGVDSATVSWQPARSCHLPILGYTVVAEPGDLTSFLPPTATTATFNNLQPGTSYTFTVTASDADGHDSLTSNTVVPGRCNEVELIASPKDSQRYGGTVLMTSSSLGCLRPLYEFEMLPPGLSVWTVARPYSSDPAFVWTTSGYPPGTYTLRVLVRDARSPGTHSDALGTFDDYGDIIYAVRSPAVS